MLLHIVNKSPFEHETLSACLTHALPEAGVLLIDDGVYGASADTPYVPMIVQALQRVSIYALRPDVAARGLQNRLIPEVQLIGYDDFVSLVTEYSGTQTWL